MHSAGQQAAKVSRQLKSALPAPNSGQPTPSSGQPTLSTPSTNSGEHSALPAPNSGQHSALPAPNSGQHSALPAPNSGQPTPEVASMSDLEQFELEQTQALRKKAGLESDSDSDDVLSDQEVMGLSDSDQTSYYDAKKEVEKNENIWGSKRNYYGGDDYESDEAREEEEQEALRLREKQLASMTAADFYEPDDLKDWKSGQTQHQIKEVNLSSMSAQDRKAFLKEVHPEVELFAKELENCKVSLEKLDNGKYDVLKKTAISSYMGMIYTFFVLFTSQASEGLVELKDHSIMKGLLKAKELAEMTQGLDKLDELEGSELEGGELEGGELEGEGEVSDEVSDEDLNGSVSGSEFESDGSESDASSGSDNFNISTNKPNLKQNHFSNDFDETPDQIEQAARQKNKRSLRFYTSQIESKKQTAAINGDMDLPYREREFERRQRLLREAKARGMQQKDELGESDQETTIPNPVYSQAKQHSQEKKENKLHQQIKLQNALKQGRIKEYLAEYGDEGKRAINYQILKNKGFTPKRKKENRNARVKKRVRYAAAQKKLKGVRRVYQEPKSAYAGEQSGIRKSVVHSRKF